MLVGIKRITRFTYRTAFVAVCAVGFIGTSPTFAQQSITVVQSPGAQPRNIMPARGGNLTWVSNVFEPLLVLDRETFQPIPVLANSWELADDGLSITFNLRDDATFHTGRKMTADDVKFTFDTAAEPATAAQTGFVAREFTAIDVISDTEIKITFSKKLNNLFDFLEETPIVDKDTYSNREDGSQVIGTGPYKFTKWTPGAEIVLEKYADYRDVDAAKISTINIAIIKDPTATVAALRSGRAQIAFNLVPQIARTLQNNPQYTTLTGGGIIFPLGLNTSTPPFDNKAVRQAVGYAIDRDRINEQVFGGTGTATALFWSPTEPGYSEALAGTYTYDPDKAKAMIEAAGAAGTKIKMIIPAIPPNRGISEVVQNNLRQIGLEPEVTVLDVPDYDKRQVAGDLDQSFILIHGQVGFSAGTLLNSLPSLREGNPSKFWPEEYQSLRNAYINSTEADAPEALEALSSYMIDEAFSLAVVQANGQTIVSTTVDGVAISRRGRLFLHGAELK